METKIDQNSYSDLISLAEAAKLSSYHQDYLGSLCRAGKLKGQKIGRNWVVSKVDLERFMGTASPELAGKTGEDDGAQQVTVQSPNVEPVKIPVKVTPSKDQLINLKLVQLKSQVRTEKVQARLGNLEGVVGELERTVERASLLVRANTLKAKVLDEKAHKKLDAHSKPLPVLTSTTKQDVHKKLFVGMLLHSLCLVWQLRWRSRRVRSKIQP